MKRFALLTAIVILSSCSQAMMTRDNYDCITVGTSIKEVQKIAGKPYAIHNKGGGTQEYEYIERINRGGMDRGTEILAENHYYLVVVDGQVVGKFIRQEKLPGFNLIYQEDPNVNY